MMHTHPHGNGYRSHSYRPSDMETLEPSFNLRLIEAVRHSRCLYDATDRQYRSTDYKNKVWSRLVQVLGYEGDARALYSRWKQLRDKYGKEKRKARYAGGLSSWQYFKHLHFLDPHMTDRQTSGSPKRPDGMDAMQVQYMTDPQCVSHLIEQVRGHPCLFDIRDPKYRHSECRNQAWHDIIKQIDFPGDVNLIYKQWKKIRDRYVREKRRLKAQRESGLAEESSWEFFEDMKWIDPYLDERAQHVKRRTEELSDYEIDELAALAGNNISYNISESTPRSKQGGGDVLLDGDSAFAASAVSDLRTLPEHARILAKSQIESLLDSGRMPLSFIQ